MKTIILLLLFAYVVTTCAQNATNPTNTTDNEAQTATTLTNTTDEGSGMDTTTPAVTPTATDLCVPQPCLNGGECSNVGGTFQCSCRPEYTGETCEVVASCETVERTVNSTRINQQCGESNDTADTTTVNFPSVYVQNVSRANITCATSNCSADFQGEPVGSLRCVVKNGTVQFEEAVSWINCGKSLSDITNPQEQADAIATITSKPDEINESQVVPVINTISDISQEPEIKPQVADTTLLAVNNLLAGPENIQDEVAAESANLLNSVDNITEKVVPADTTALTGYIVYENQQSSLALAVVVAETTKRRRREITNPIYYGMEGTLDVDSLALADLRLFSSEPSGSYIAVTAPAESDRSSFQIFAAKTPLFNSTELIVDVVVSASGGNEYIFKFRRSDEEDDGIIDSNGEVVTDDSNIRTTVRLRCVSWNQVERSWNDAGCTSYSSSGEFVSCQCTKSGDYSLNRNVLVEELGDDGLSGGAIAGIVIGCVAGVAIIIGLIYYFGFYKKKSKKQKVKPLESSEEDIPMNYSHDNKSMSRDDD